MDNSRNNLPPAQGFSPPHVSTKSPFAKKQDQLLWDLPNLEVPLARLASTVSVNGASNNGPTGPKDIQVPPLNMPQGPPRNWDRGAMVKRVRMGMMIELSTIPLYLYAMYSVKPKGDGIQIRATLRAVVQQEMLHLALAGNLLSAIDGSIDLYDSRIVPQYESTILVGNIPMSLERLTSESLGHFMEIESASDGYSLARPGPIDRTTLASQYSSIGELYEDLIIGVRGLSDKEFANNEDKQFSGNDFFGDQLFAVTNQATALQALRTIIEQGEGNIGVPDSHYDVFSRLYSKPNSWEVHPVPYNPTTIDYAGEPFIYQLSLAFDAAYCYLLQTIQRVWNTSNTTVRRVLFRNIHSIMSNVLTPLAELLVQQPWQGGVAGPCFNYYAKTGDFDIQVMHNPNPLKPEELHPELGNRIVAAATAFVVAVVNPAKEAVDEAKKAVDKAARKLEEAEMQTGKEDLEREKEQEEAKLEAAEAKKKKAENLKATLDRMKRHVDSNIRPSE